MTAAEKRYPDWVQEQRTRGTTVKKSRDMENMYSFHIPRKNAVSISFNYSS